MRHKPHKIHHYLEKSFQTWFFVKGSSLVKRLTSSGWMGRWLRWEELASCAVMRTEPIPLPLKHSRKEQVWQHMPVALLCWGWDWDPWDSLTWETSCPRERPHLKDKNQQTTTKRDGWFLKTQGWPLVSMCSHVCTNVHHPHQSLIIYIVDPLNLIGYSLMDIAVTFKLARPWLILVQGILKQNRICLKD